MAKSTKPKAKPKPKPAPRPVSRRGRADELRRQRERRSLRNRMIAAAVVLVLVGGIAYAKLTEDSAPPIVSAQCTTDEKHDGGNESDHIPSPSFEVNPPAGGAHTSTAASPGFYKDGGGSVPSDGQLVHAQEHGFVVLWYKPDLPAEDMAKLERLSDDRGRELILVPRRSLGGPVAVTAWHHRLLCSGIDTTAISQFVERYRDKGPEKGFL